MPVCPEKVLLDPYGLAVAVPETYDLWAAARAGDTAATAMKSVAADPDRYGGLTRAGTRSAMQTLSGQPEVL
jgi:hypothetical protein